MNDMWSLIRKDFILLCFTVIAFVGGGCRTYYSDQIPARYYRTKVELWNSKANIAGELKPDIKECIDLQRQLMIAITEKEMLQLKFMLQKYPETISTDVSANPWISIDFTGSKMEELENNITQYEPIAEEVKKLMSEWVSCSHKQEAINVGKKVTSLPAGIQAQKKHDKKLRQIAKDIENFKNSHLKTE